MTKQQVFLNDAAEVQRWLENAQYHVNAFNAETNGKSLFPVVMWVATSGSLISVEPDSDPFERFAAAIVLNEHPCDGDVIFSCHWGINEDGVPDLDMMTVCSKDYPRYGKGSAQRYVPAHQVEMLAPLLPRLVSEVVEEAAMQAYAKHPCQTAERAKIAAVTDRWSPSLNRSRFVYQGEDEQTVWTEL